MSSDEGDATGSSWHDSSDGNNSEYGGRHTRRFVLGQAQRSSARKPVLSQEDSQIVQALRSSDRRQPPPPAHTETTGPIVLIETRPSTSNSGTASRPSRMDGSSRQTAGSLRRKKKKKRRLNPSAASPHSSFNSASTPKKQLGGPKQDPNKVSRPARIPPWQTLPYHVLVQIFDFAASALETDKSLTQGRGHWLARVARTCRSFVEPALAALYYAPPLVRSHRAHGLLKILETDREATFITYGSKVRRLQIEVLQTLFYTIPGQGRFDLAALLKHTPQLEELDLIHLYDMPPYRTDEKNRKWFYPTSLFEALDGANIRLRMWRWNARMTGPDYSPTKLESVHKRTAFQSLEHLVLVNYRHSKPDRQDDGEISAEDGLSRALLALPNLRQLTCETCEIVDESFLDRLSLPLEAVTFINCLNLTSWALQAFLTKHGSHLKELTLNHNCSLNLSFLTTLRSSCPRLEIFKVDLLFFSRRILFKDSAPRFDTLLEHDEVPSWPSSLRHLELLQLRQWDSDAAGLFFRSLIESAPELPNLRVLILKAMVKLSWRDRASFRGLWGSRLQTVFLRRSDPSESVRLAQGLSDGFQAQPAQRERAKADTDESSTQQSADGTPARRSSRLKEGARQEASMLENQRSSSETESSDEAPARKRGKLNGSIGQGRPKYIEFDPSEDNPAFEDGVDDRNVAVQGMCHVVDVRIDNTRLTENQFDEGDFLDDEASGDEDWDGGDSDQADTYAW